MAQMLKFSGDEMSLSDIDMADPSKKAKVSDAEVENQQQGLVPVPQGLIPILLTCLLPAKGSLYHWRQGTWNVSWALCSGM